MKLLCVLAAVLVVVLLTAQGYSRPLESSLQDLRKPFAVVEPIEGHTKLQLNEAGLDTLRKILGPVLPVVVIGPYRSGKSFLLNQLLGIGCEVGFGVGHTRSTQTKGVWIWGEPQPAVVNGRPVSLVYVDTEGFESTGKADAYDDRIFALSTLISAVLVYNLPETIRESDIEKLSFAVELAEGFYGDVQKGQAAPVAPGAMLWLIQRDFLEGKTVNQMVREALAPVDNPSGDKDIGQVNKIRESLQLIAANSSAFGLRQPHLERTRLCQLDDAALDPGYVAQRAALRRLVHRLAQPKVVNGKELTGPDLADLISRMVLALNSRDIPTAGSILEHFNRELMAKVEAQYVASLLEMRLPMDETSLQAWHAKAVDSALARFDAEKFGNDLHSQAGSLREQLQAAMEKEFEARRTGNRLESIRVCERLEQTCEDLLEREQRVRLPSTGRFSDRFARCRANFASLCIGPAHSQQAERLDKAWRREAGRFTHDYNDKLFNGLVVLMLIDIMVFRFLVKISIMETLGWVAFVFLQVYPKLYLNGGSAYDRDDVRDLNV
ncbi:hypothetical protein WJX72_005008 [[Myrmecia] bisecta]|uniref:GB1/RHD3-type G domain-containing protein n=1 Tax=[Myrmecia] bisecta TaxID=41462 RepID=A0AAW1PPS5_9CHLO